MNNEELKKWVTCLVIISLLLTISVLISWVTNFWLITKTVELSWLIVRQ